MIKKFFITLWVLLFIGISSIALLFFAISQGWIGYLPDMEELENPSYKYASQIISSDGKPLGTFPAAHPAPLGISYLHLITLAEEADYDGTLIKSIEKTN